MSFKPGFVGNNKRVFAYSILAVSVVAALSSVGIAFAATSTSSTASSSTSIAGQSGSGSQSSTASSGHVCPNMGSQAAGNSTSVTGTAG